MKKFKLAPLAIALAGALAVVTPSVVGAADLPRQGDLDIYASGSSTADKSPTLMLVIEGSTFTNYADNILNPGEVAIIGIADDSETVPSYKRYDYYNTFSHTRFPTRLTRMKDALFYLMDTPGLLPDNYRIGLTRYSAGVTTLDNPRVNGDSTTGAVVVAAKSLGPVNTHYRDPNGEYILDSEQAKFVKVQDATPNPNINYNDRTLYPRYTKANDCTYLRDDEGNYLIENGKRVESHRCKIKTYIAEMCANDRFCTGEAPMAAAYAEAGAYMMGTKTSQLTRSTSNQVEVGEGETTTTVQPYVRALRFKGGSYSGKINAQWQYCPPADRVRKDYVGTQGSSDATQVRFECPDDSWVDISSNNVADGDWAFQTNGDKEDEVADTNEIASIEGKNSYDLTWWKTTFIDAPYGVRGMGWDTVGGGQGGKRMSPISRTLREYDFRKDALQNVNPTPANPNGLSDEWTYLYDNTLVSEVKLQPLLRYRAIRSKYVGRGNYKKNAYGEFINADGEVVPENSSEKVETPTRLWQHCPLTIINEAGQRVDNPNLILTNNIYSSYRLDCKEEGWVDIVDSYWSYPSSGRVIYNRGPYNIAVYYEAGQAGRDAERWGLKWNANHLALLQGGRPCGIDAVKPSRLCKGAHTYIYDGIVGKNGWAYWWDQSFDRSQYPALPPTLNIGYNRSGIRNSPPEVRSYKGYTYDKPEYSECSGQVQLNSVGEVESSKPQTVENAILFITAGIPRAGELGVPTNEMGMSLTEATSNVVNPVGGVFTCPDYTPGSSVLDPAGYPINDFWNCIGEYSKRLREPAKNPAGIGIKTGVFLFANNRNSNLPVTGIVDGVKTYNCNALTKKTWTNACLLGQYGEGFGEGGFFLSTSADPESSYKNLANAIVKMADNLNTDLGLVPTAPIAVPQDDYNNDTMLEYGYLPLMAPNTTENADIGRTAQWPGNLRKYKQVNGAYVDKNNDSPYSNDSIALLSATSEDYWTSSGGSYNSSKQKGGAFSQVPMPTSGSTDTPRKVYLSETSNGSLKQVKPKMDLGGASGNKEIAIADVLVDGIGDIPTGSSAEVVAEAKKERNVLRRLLLNYMGYSISELTDTTTTQQIIDTAAGDANKSLGGVFHSTPIALTSNLKLDASGTYKPEHQYILFGAMDNAVHVVLNEDPNHTSAMSSLAGKEVMSYFPREVLANNAQYKAITPELLAYRSKGEASPSFGVDAPWASYSTYGPVAGSYDEIEAKKLYAFGGARLGAKAYYGIDLTGIHKTGFNPKQLFTITPETNSVFSRLGYTWGKPVITKIRWQGEPKLVAILTGGYDTHYDKTDAERKAELADTATQAPETKGNAVYIVDAETGVPLIVASNDGATASADGAVVGKDTNNSASSIIKVGHTKLRYSIAGSVKTVDRDADAMVDSIYFADLNGQVFRMDIDNAASQTATGTTATGTTATAQGGTNPNVRVTRLADLKDANTLIGPRFYEAPIVTIHENEKGTRFAVVSVASGDRSNPLYVPKDGDENYNHVYAIYDKDLVKTNLFTMDADDLVTKDITSADLVDQPSSTSGGGTTSGVSNYSKYGWKSPLKTFTSKVKVNNTIVTQNVTTKALKALGPMSALGNKLYIPAYNPIDDVSEGINCTAGVRGSTEAVQYCLPYGVCDSSKDADDQFNRTKIGKGIQGVVFGSSGKNDTDRVLLTSKPSTKTPVSNGNGSLGSTVSPAVITGLNPNAEDIKSSYTFKPFLKPMMWYDLQSQKLGTTTTSGS